jgi:hypothetical protein
MGRPEIQIDRDRDRDWDMRGPAQVESKMLYFLGALARKLSPQSFQIAKIDLDLIFIDQQF